MDIVIVIISLGCCQYVGGRMIDMSYPLGPNSPAYPGHPAFTMTNIATGDKKYGIWVEYNAFSTGEHRGTHVDAPRHFARNGVTMDKVPLEKFMGPGIVLRAVEEAKNSSDFQITKEWLTEWESNNGRVPEKSVVLMDFGWGERTKTNNMKKIYDSETPYNTRTIHFPGLHRDAMEFLILERKINMIAMDTPSVDYALSTTFPTHVVAASNGVPIVENVANIDQLPLTGSHIMSAPIRLKGGSGVPLRIFATVDEDFSAYVCSAPATSQQFVLVFLLLCISFILY